MSSLGPNPSRKRDISFLMSPSDRAVWSEPTAQNREGGGIASAMAESVNTAEEFSEACCQGVVLSQLAPIPK